MIGKEVCTGCRSCYYWCPQKAITIEKKDNSFIKNVDESKCIDCGVCEEICHMNNMAVNNTIHTYVAASRVPEDRKHGASGGIASTFYRYGLENEYICIGTKVMNRCVDYCVIDSISEIRSTSGSRYVNSHLDSIFVKFSEIFAGASKVIFIGLPCHCASVKKLLVGSECDVLFVDLVCNGVCDDETLIKFLEQNSIDFSSIRDIRFRDKNNQYGMTFIDGTGMVTRKISNSQNEYMKKYGDGEIQYDFCIGCKYAQCKRVGDITLKDYVGKYGWSNVLINTDKGNEFWEKVKKLLYYRNYSVDKVREDDKRIR